MSHQGKFSFHRIKVSLVLKSRSKISYISHLHRYTVQHLSSMQKAKSRHLKPWMRVLSSGLIQIFLPRLTKTCYRMMVNLAKIITSLLIHNRIKLKTCYSTILNYFMMVKMKMNTSMKIT